jgi:transposase
MVSVLDELELTELVTSIEGLSPVGAAAILAETGDLTRFTSARAVVKHAGLAPRERKSGTFTGRARVTGAGRHCCAPPPGGPCGAACRPTGCTPPATAT